MQPSDLGQHSAPSNREDNRPKTVMRVMTYNIHSCVNKNRHVNPGLTAAIIQELNADIVALQEVDAPTLLRSNQNQARFLAKHLGMDHAFFPVEKRGLHAFGLAILSRYAIKESHHNHLPKLYPRLKPRKRGAIRASIQTPSGPIHIINAHLSLFKLERRRQVKRLLGKSWLAALPQDEPLILCGDLNAGPRSKTYRTLSRYLTDVQKDLKGQRPFLTQPTFHSSSPLFRIDHIFISPQLKTIDVAVIRTPDTAAASDHLPLIADLAIN
jgi:endonuclease/exonuclease/phosphatase family metal-dependent hydrolase